jgi:hypothetical protein
MDLAEKENKLKYTQREGQVLTLTPKPYPISQKKATSVTPPLSNTALMICPDSPYSLSPIPSYMSLFSCYSFLNIPTFVAHFSSISYGCRPDSLDPFSYA